MCVQCQLTLAVELITVNHTLGQTVEKPGVQPRKTVPAEFPRAQPERTPGGQFFQAAWGFSTVSQTLLTP